MMYYIIIPAHNEEAFIAKTLNSILHQTLAPKKVIIVNDNSTDGTETIIDSFTDKHSIFKKVNTTSSTKHMPGSKVINAFTKGLDVLDNKYDFIVKLDADIILPENYFEKIAGIFKSDKTVGIAGGFAYEEDKNGNWKLNHPMNKDHVRGAFKAYRKSCFKSINGLRSAMGWDTVDELLTQYNNYTIYTDTSLKVKHLRPTGNAYNKQAKLLQGKAMYAMRYGFVISCIASLKMGLKQKKAAVFFDNLSGYSSAKKEKLPFLVTPKEGNFIRNLRWKNIKSKLF
ncbi:glycosyltransferase family 2 protein [Cellulophaga fucicola]|uniref:Glycosyl transferase family 2 n=1 Tax=Cellulophaga fucicola TaxID=76595 RepID=A0A1K1P3B1_9FLAO|nr:glycosyltransferase family 2 protein [Cellulophaga fucicola]SFW42274.1 Glycosyl transferase family 2 [Cellulophaga fucicola]